MGASYTPRSSVFLSRSRSQTPERMRPLITVSTGDFGDLHPLSTRRRRFTSYVHPSDLRLIRFARPVRAPLGLLRRLRTGRYRFCTRRMATGSNTIPGPSSNHSLHATSCRTDRGEYSPSRESGSRALARPGAEIRPMPAGGLSVPSCSEPGRIYRVSLAGEGAAAAQTGGTASSPASTSSRRSSGRRSSAGRSSWRSSGGRP